MKKVTLTAVHLVLLAVVTASSSWAQATRTWVSGVGDDANPCSRTAPCKTFAGAISKTAAKGEINVLDPGGFGGVTITKSISILAESVEAGVLVSGTNAIIVNAAVGDVIVLRGLDIEGLGTGLNGIQFLAGGTLRVENCTIHNFTQSGINFAPSAASANTSRLFVNNTVVSNPVSTANFAGIMVNPGTNVTAEASLSDVRLYRNPHGLRVQGNSRVMARNVTASSNAGTGFLVTAGTNAQLNLDGCEASMNANGIRADGANATVRMANCLVANNTANGLLFTAPGAIVSFGNNRVAGNAGASAPSSTVGQI